MTGFSATDAALEGFRITRERPRALIVWAAFCFAVSVAGVLITVNMPAEARAALESLQSDPSQPPDGKALMEALATLSPMLIFGLAVQCIMAAAVYRIILRPADEKFSYLRLGKDELRLMALSLILLVLGVMMLAAAQIVIGVVSFLASAFGQAVFGFVFAAAEVFALGLFLYVAVRMSLAPVMTFDRGRLVIFESWSVTRGQFWRLIGAYALAICCVIVVAVLVWLLFIMVGSIAMVATGGGMADLVSLILVQSSEVTLSAYLNPFMIAYMVVGSVFTAIYYAVIAAPGAWAYHELMGKVP